MRAHETLERAGRHGGFPARGSASGLLAACPSDGSHDFYLSMMLDVPVPRVPMLRARLQDSRRGAQRASDAQDVLLQCLLGGFGSVFPQCGLMVFPGVVIVSR